MMSRLHINPVNPQPRNINQAVDILHKGGLVIYPTDTVYGLGCDLFNKKAIGRIYQIKGKGKRKLLSFICPDLKDISKYAYVSTPAYKIMRHLLPGPYTFILPATHLVPHILLEKKRTVGIRVPENVTCQLLLEAFGKPIISTSARIEESDFLNDPDQIYDLFKHTVDIFLDSGFSHFEPSTVVDLTDHEPVILRQGLNFDLQKMPW
jgi:tRNA threonylcarbamoyl adenosine modification protein (Sua5/YciO/YrdC/YwlC family)